MRADIKDVRRSVKSERSQHTLRLVPSYASSASSKPQHWLLYVNGVLVDWPVTKHHGLALLRKIAEGLK